MNHADIIFFAIIAVYLGLKLFNTLGKKEEGEDYSSSAKSLNTGNDLIEKLQEKSAKDSAQLKESDINKVREDEVNDYSYSNEKAKAGILDIINSDRNFYLSEFIGGAKAAFEIITDAYSKKDKNIMRDLMAKPVFEQLDSYISEIEKKGYKDVKSLISIKDREITEAGVEGNIATIKVLFDTEQINFTRDQEGKIVDGDEKFIEEIQDEWAFERNIRSINPNWKIIAI